LFSGRRVPRGAIVCDRRPRRSVRRPNWHVQDQAEVLRMSERGRQQAVQRRPPLGTEAPRDERAGSIRCYAGIHCCVRVKIAFAIPV